MIDWLSQCCDAPPLMEVDISTIPYGGPTGFCSHCKDLCDFYSEDPGDHFDTRAEKYGER